MTDIRQVEREAAKDAEIERLKAWVIDERMKRHKTVEDVMSARAEIERLKADANRPWLGLATTRELLDELCVRIEIHALGGLDYRTVDGEKFAEAPVATAHNDDELRIEIERLRAALVAITKIELDKYGPDWGEIGRAQDIANAALAGKDTT